MGGILILILWRYIWVESEDSQYSYQAVISCSEYCSISKFESSQDESNLYKNSVQVLMDEILKCGHPINSYYLSFVLFVCYFFFSSPFHLVVL